MTELIFSKNIINIKFSMYELKMFSVYGLVLYFFELMLGIFFQYGLNFTNECIRFSQALFQKGHEFVPEESGKLVALYAGLLLLLFVYDTIFQEIYSKGYMFLILWSDHHRILFILLIKVVVFHISVTIV